MQNQHPSSTGSFSSVNGYATGSYARAGGRQSRKGASRKRSWYWVFLAIIIALVASYLVAKEFQNASGAQQDTVAVPVVVAAKNVSLGTTLTEEHFRIIQWPEEFAPTARFSQISELVGRVAKVDMFEGEMIHEARLAPVDAGNGINALIPSGMRAQAIKVNDESGVAGFIHSGDFVDVVMIFRVRNEKMQTDTESRTAIQNVKVLAIGDQYQTPEESRGKAIKVPVVTVLVTPYQAEQLALATTNGKVVLTLRNGYDSEEVVSTGFSPNRILENNEPTLPTVIAVKPQTNSKEETKTKKQNNKKGNDVKKSGDTTDTISEELPPRPTVQIIRGDKVVGKNKKR